MDNSYEKKKLGANIDTPKWAANQYPVIYLAEGQMNLCEGHTMTVSKFQKKKKSFLIFSLFAYVTVRLCGRQEVGLTGCRTHNMGG